jgi:hypothetical protein
LAVDFSEAGRHKDRAGVGRRSGSDAAIAVRNRKGTETGEKYYNGEVGL